MTVKGHDFILQCRQCFNEKGAVVRLDSGVSFHTCPNCRSSYRVDDSGFLERVR